MSTAPSPTTGPLGELPEDLTELSVAAAGAAFRAGVLDPVALTEAYLERIDALDGRIHAYVVVTPERAREDARRATAELAAGHDRGPLHGIPVAVKDLIDTAGITTAGGSGAYRGRVPARDATVMTRLSEAGAVLLGKTNTHELAMGVTTTNPHFGATRNPWDLARIPGGSSGGSGAAVAARLAALAIGTDTGGSVRIPAALCGVVGLKPTFGRIARDGVLAMSPTCDHVGVLTRSVDDAAVALAVLSGACPDDPASLPLPSWADAALIDGRMPAVRIGVARQTMWLLAEQDVRARADAGLDLLRGLGAEIVEIDLPDQLRVLGMPGGSGCGRLWVEESRWAHRAAWAADPSRFGPDVAAFYSMPPSTTSLLLETFELLDGFRVALRRAYAEVDLLASPTTVLVAPPIGTEVVSLGGVELPLAAACVLDTMPFNVGRGPAISLPCGLTRAGLPVGLQLAAAELAETLLLQVASAYEAVAPWQLAPELSPSGASASGRSACRS